MQQSSVVIEEGGGGRGGVLAVHGETLDIPHAIDLTTFYTLLSILVY